MGKGGWSRSSSRGAENNKLQLSSRKKGKAVGSVVGKQVSTSTGTEGDLFIRFESFECRCSNQRSGGMAGMSLRGVKVQNFRDSARGSGNGWLEESLRKGKPKLEGVRRKRETAVDGGRIDSRAESEKRNPGGTVGEVVGDGVSDGHTKVVTKTKGNKIVDKEKSGTDTRAAASSFESSIVGAARDVPKSGNKFGRAVEEGVLE